MRTVLPLLCVLSTACADRDWRAAASAGTSRAYATYAQTHPGTAKASTALRRAEDLAWDEAVAAHTSLAFDGFRAAYPQSPHAPEAAAQAEQLAWDEAGAAGTVQAYTQFLARWPRSPRAPEAEQRIEELAWRDATTANTEEAFGRYLLRYPNGPHAVEARTRREDLGWSAAVATDTVDAYERFLRVYEGGAHTAEAQAWLAQTHVGRVHPVVVLLTDWQDDKLRSTILARYKTALDGWLRAGLGREFTLDPVSLVDAKKTTWSHPHDLFGAAEDTGVLVLEITEKRGRAFEPSGYATNVEARLSFYAPHTRTAVIEHALRASTPVKVKGIDESALHTGAVAATIEQVAATEAELLRQRKTP